MRVTFFARGMSRGADMLCEGLVGVGHLAGPSAGGCAGAERGGYGG